MRIHGAVIALPVLLLLAGCGDDAPAPTAATTAPATSAAPSAPTTPAAPPELGPDVLLVVSATATADNGSVLDLTMIVHKATAWNDPSGAARAALMTSTCEGFLDAGVYEANLWSFLTVDVTAQAAPGSPAWPSAKRIRLFPAANDDYSLASDGTVVKDPDVGSETPDCARDRYIYVAGVSTLVVGIPGDTDAVAAAGNFTRWANTRYGFVGRETGDQTAAKAGITVTNCTSTVTPAGEELHGGASWWSSHTDDSNCYVGSTSS